MLQIGSSPHINKWAHYITFMTEASWSSEQHIDDIMLTYEDLPAAGHSLDFLEPLVKRIDQ